MASVEMIGANAVRIPKSSTTNPVSHNIPAIASCARTFLRLNALKDGTFRDAGAQWRAKLLAQGGYNDVWLLTSENLGEDDDASLESFILRLPNSDSLAPHQARNEVGWLRYMKKQCPEIPVPRVYEYSEGTESERAFIALEYINGTSLDSAWKTYSETEKHQVASKIAETIVRLGEKRFEFIGGMQLDGETAGPTVEGAKLFKGRDAFHDPACYNIGPYASTQQYILACYDKEIHYYSNAPESVFDEDTFESESRVDFILRLQTEKLSVQAQLEATPIEEPFVLCHNDFQARNIIMKGTEIAAVIDWEFAGSFLLSELSDGGFEVLEIEDEVSEEECHSWGRRISELTEKIAKERLWQQKYVGLLISEGHRVLQAARVEMMPEYSTDEG